MDLFIAGSPRRYECRTVQISNLPCFGSWSPHSLTTMGASQDNYTIFSRLFSSIGGESFRSLCSCICGRTLAPPEDTNNPPYHAAIPGQRKGRWQCVSHFRPRALFFFSPPALAPTCQVCVWVDTATDGKDPPDRSETVCFDGLHRQLSLSGIVFGWNRCETHTLGLSILSAKMMSFTAWSNLFNFKLWVGIHRWVVQ